MRKSLVVAALLAGGVACSDVQSEDVFTDGMYADLDVVATGDGTSTANAVLKVGGATSTTFVELTADDALTVSLDGAEPVPMNELELGDWHGYSASLQGDSTESEFVIAFTRTVDDGAPSSTITLADPFTLGTVASESSRGADLAITWDPSGVPGQTMSITVTGDCVIAQVQTVDDTGSYTFLANTITTAEGNESATCPITIDVRRYETGAVDPAFGEGGAAVGIQERTATTQSVP
jgi:hypothetical protein